MIYAIHHHNGEIVRTVTCDPSQAEGQLKDGELFLTVSGSVSDSTHYISSGQAVEKAAITAAVSVTGDDAVVMGIPAGLEVSFDGVTATTDDDPLELTIDEPDTYVLRIDGGVRYLDAELVIDFG